MSKLPYRPMSSRLLTSTQSAHAQPPQSKSASAFFSAALASKFVLRILIPFVLELTIPLILPRLQISLNTASSYPFQTVFTASVISRLTTKNSQKKVSTDVSAHSFGLTDMVPSFAGSLPSNIAINVDQLFLKFCL